MCWHGCKSKMIAELKRGVSLSQYVQIAGIELRQQGTRLVGLCPFHADTTPSFFIFPDQRFKCFGCQERGDVIDFIQKLYGLSFPDALKHLGIDNRDRKITPKMRKEIEQRKQRAALVKRFRTWERKKVDELATLVRCIHRVTKKWKTAVDLELYGQILHMLPLYEYQLSLLIFGNDKEKFEFHKEAPTCRNKFLT